MICFLGFSGDCPGAYALRMDIGFLGDRVGVSEGSRAMEHNFGALIVFVDMSWMALRRQRSQANLARLATSTEAGHCLCTLWELS